MKHDIIKGSDYIYRIDTSYGLTSDGYIATGTESIVYKGQKISADGKICLSCVLKFKFKSIKMGSGENELKTVNVLERFKNNDLRIFDDLQNCRSVVRIYDVIEDLGDFSVVDTHVPEGQPALSIDRSMFFCVVEEYIDGWSLEEYCRDEYWHLTETVDIGNDLKRKVLFHEFPEEKKNSMIKSYEHDYDEVIRYQNEMFRFMINLCEILEYITDIKHILHLDLKPDNIMVTRHGKEIVLIDFGRSEYIPEPDNFVQSRLSGADYNSEEKIARMFQYGTLGYAAPECYVEPINGSKFPFDDKPLKKGRMSIESDIFSFGATFWECLNMFELYTKSPEFAKDKGVGGSYDFYRNHFLNDDAYCDRDLSLTSPHYHEKLQEIIAKCTRRREDNYFSSDNDNFYHSYSDLKYDIEYARDSSPTLVKTENIKVRNSFGVVGVMIGLLIVLGALCGILKLSGSYFANQKLESIMGRYNPTMIERLQNAAIEQMDSSTKNERQSTYNRIYQFMIDNDESLDHSEAVVLVDLLKMIDNNDFRGSAVDNIIRSIRMEDLSSSVQYIITGLDDNIPGAGYELAAAIYNAQHNKELDKCFDVAAKYIDSQDLHDVAVRLAKVLEHDDIIRAIADSRGVSRIEIQDALRDMSRG